MCLINLKLSIYIVAGEIVECGSDGWDEYKKLIMLVALVQRHDYNSETKSSNKDNHYQLFVFSTPLQSLNI